MGRPPVSLALVLLAPALGVFVTGPGGHLIGGAVPPPTLPPLVTPVPGPLAKPIAIVFSIIAGAAIAGGLPIALVATIAAPVLVGSPGASGNAAADGSPAGLVVVRPTPGFAPVSLTPAWRIAPLRPTAPVPLLAA